MVMEGTRLKDRVILPATSKQAKNNTILTKHFNLVH